MPLGPFGEVLSSTGTLEGLSEKLKNYKSKVIAPRNPKLLKTPLETPTVFSYLIIFNLFFTVFFCQLNFINSFVNFISLASNRFITLYITLSHSFPLLNMLSK